MNTSLHLSEPALQVAADPAAQLPATEMAHLRTCPLCQGRVATYHQLLGTVAALPAPAFEFDLAASVIAQLPRPRLAFPWVLCAVVGALVLVVVIGFLALFGGVLALAFEGLSAGLGLGLAAVAGLLIGGQALELLARHRRQLRQLAFS